MSNRKDSICFRPSEPQWVDGFFTGSRVVGSATSHDRLAANDLAFVQIASIRLWLRASTPSYAHTLSLGLAPANVHCRAQHGRAWDRVCRS